MASETESDKATQIAAFKDWLRKAKNDPRQLGVDVWSKGSQYGLDINDITEVMTELENENN